MSIIMSPEILGLLVCAIVMFSGLAIASMKKVKKIKIANRIQIDKDKAAIEDIIKEIKNEESIINNENGLTWFQKRQRELKQSNSGITLPVYITIMVISMMTIFFLVYKIIGIAFIAIAFSFIGIIVPNKIVKIKVDKNVANFNSQLVKALRRMASVMRSGGSLKQALVDVTKSRSMPLIIRIEFKKVLTDIEYGMVVEGALYKLYERTGSEDVQFLAVAVEIQRQLGGNIAQIFDTISATISNRNLMQGEVKATLAQANTTSTILSVIPFALGGMLYFLNPTYYDPLFESLSGKMIFLGCISMIGMGVFVIKKLSKIKL